MKVVLKASVLEAIQKRIDEAKRNRREIEHIIVSEEEYAQLRHECYRGELDMGFNNYMRNPCAEMSMTMRTIDLDDPSYPNSARNPKMRFASRNEKLYGFDLYVVPARFAK